MVLEILIILHMVLVCNGASPPNPISGNIQVALYGTNTTTLTLNRINGYSWCTCSKWSHSNYS